MCHALSDRIPINDTVALLLVYIEFINPCRESSVANPMAVS